VKLKGNLNFPLAGDHTMKHLLATLAILTLFASTVRAEVPKPSPYPISWELKFKNSIPKRVVVEVPGERVPQPYWYITYTVTNKTNSEQTFLPVFQMLTNEGKVIESDRNIPLKVYEVIKSREANKYLEHPTKVAGTIRVGEGEAKDSIAIWPEPNPEMGQFSIFVSGLSGEAIILKDDKGEPMKNKEGKPVILYKTLQLNYFIRGDDVYPGEDEVNQNASTWVMR
jgi:hypothetical protein